MMTKIINTNFVLYSIGCENRCLFCVNSPCSKIERGDVEKNIKEQIEKIRRLKKELYQIGILDISGNDPGEFEQLPSLVRIIKEIAKPQEIQLSTHGMTLADNFFLNKLLQSGVTSFRIPIYGHKSQIHDQVTQNKGSFDKLLKGLVNLNVVYFRFPQTIKVSFVTAVLKVNQDYLDKILSFVIKLGFIKKISFELAGFVPEKKHFLSQIPNFEKLSQDLPRILFSFKSKLGKKGICLFLRDIPPCIIQVDWPYIDYFKPPFRGYSHFGKKDEEPPIYMEKIKVAACQKCFYQEKCHGFLKTYLEANVLKLNPLRKLRK